MAERNVYDENRHCILEGSRYFVCQYLEKEDFISSGRNKTISYKMLKGEIFILPKQIFYPCVNLSSNLKMSLADYQFLADCV